MLRLFFRLNIKLINNLAQVFRQNDFDIQFLDVREIERIFEAGHRLVNRINPYLGRFAVIALLPVVRLGVKLVFSIVFDFFKDVIKLKGFGLIRLDNPLQLPACGPNDLVISLQAIFELATQSLQFLSAFVKAFLYGICELESHGFSPEWSNRT